VLVHPALGLLIVILTDVWLQTPFYRADPPGGAADHAPRAPRGGAGGRGPNAWQVFRNVTLPLLRPVLLVAIVIRSVDAFRVFDTCGRSPRGSRGGPPRSSASTPTRRRSSSSTSGWAPPRSLVRRRHHHAGGVAALRRAHLRHRGVAVRQGGRTVFVALVLAALFALMLFPVFWLTLTALRPESEVFYVHRGTHLHARELREGVAGAEDPGVVSSTARCWRPWRPSSRSRSPAERLHAVPLQGGGEQRSGSRRSICSGRCTYITWVLPLLPPDAGPRHLRLPIWACSCPTSPCTCLLHQLVMKGFFDGVEPEMEHAAYIDGVLALGRVRADRAAAGAGGDRGARHPLLAVHLGTSSCSP